MSDSPACILCIVLLLAGVADARAQSRSDCRSDQPPSLGASFGRSDPYIELQAGAVAGVPPGTVIVGRGAELAGRLDVPLMSPLRARIEGATARWDVRRQLYDPSSGYKLVSDESIDHMSAHHLTAILGLRTGWPPACAFVGAGGGFYSIGFRGAAVRSPGIVFTAGIELPAGQHGAIQLDATLHLIQTRSREPIAMSTVPTLSLLAGWAYRF